MNSYQEFILWVQNDFKSDQVLSRKRYVGMILWCLLVPFLALVLNAFSKNFGWVSISRISEPLFFLSPLGFSAWTFFRSAKGIPSAFRRGGVVGVLDQGLSEVEWAQKSAAKLYQSWKPSALELEECRRLFNSFIYRQRAQSRNFSMMSAVSLFFVSYFLDYSSSAGQELLNETISTGVILNWATDVSQWIYQATGIVLIALLIYSIGNQSILALERYRMLLDAQPKN